MDAQDRLRVGQELDALTATHVCQWTDVRYDAELRAYYGWLPDATREDNRARVPPYSTDISATWMLFPVLRQRSLMPAFLRELDRHYAARGASPPGAAYALLTALFADRWASGAICRAALRAAGVMGDN